MRAEIALKTLENLSSEPRRAVALYPVVLDGTSFVEVGTIAAPDLPAGVPVGPASDDPQDLDLGDGLHLTVRRADLKPAPGTRIDRLAAREIPPERRPRYAALAGEEVVAVYALSPFGATSSSPMAVRIPSSLPRGTAVKLRTVGELDGVLSAPVAGEADGEFVRSAEGGGIAELTWVVVSR